MPQAAGDLYEARFVCELAPQISVNVWHFRITSALLGGVTDQELATSIDTLNGPQLKAAIGFQARYRGVGIKKFFPLPIGVETVAVAQTGFGTRITNPLPKQVSGLLAKRTAVPGKSGRGRMYVPFPVEEDNELTGSPTAGYITALTTLRDGFLGEKTVLGAGGTSVSYRWGVRASNPSAVNDIVSVTVRGRWATQRRRGDFGRANTVPF